MKNDQIYSIINNYPAVSSNFVGVFSIDTTPILKEKQILIFNQDFSQNEGIHWLALFRTKKNCIECFDSLGLSNEKQQLIKKNIVFDSNVKFVKFNKTPFQSSSSNTCGYFALFYCINRVLNFDLSFEKFLDAYFTTDCEKNEKNVLTFFNQI